jgi:hypothetical protein
LVKNKFLVELYGKLKKFFTNRLDIVSYLKLLEKFEVFTYLMLNKNQMMFLNREVKANLALASELARFEQIDFNNIFEENILIEYFQKRKDMNELDEIDLKMLNKYEGTAI